MRIRLWVGSLGVSKRLLPFARYLCRPRAQTAGVPPAWLPPLPGPAEAVNFALEGWLEAGQAAVPCTCSCLPEGVSLDMGIFLPELREDDSEEEEDESSGGHVGCGGWDAKKGWEREGEGNFIGPVEGLPSKQLCSIAAHF